MGDGTVEEKVREAEQAARAGRIRETVERHRRVGILALTLWEPWATAIARGWKTIETRAWDTPYRGLLAIHAARTTKVLKQPSEFGYASYVDDLLSKAGVPWHFPVGYPWPLGKIVAIARLEECVPTEHYQKHGGLTAREHALGNFEPGRFGWVLRDVVPTVNSAQVAVRGLRKLWPLHPEMVSLMLDVWKDGMERIAM